MLFFLLSTFLGILFGWIMFQRLRFLPKYKSDAPLPNIRISVIIPMRNEEHNIPNLLQDLAQQTLPPHEIICVDDGSTDSSAKIALERGAKTLYVSAKPRGWMGKCYACHTGSLAASGSMLLFLDADVRLHPNALKRLLQASAKYGPVVSVQPWHSTKRSYEQFCLFFNLIAAVSLAAPSVFGRSTSGLYGPVILIPTYLYEKSGGHAAVKNCILDDLSLGRRLTQIGITPYCCIGDLELQYRMYPHGYKSMLEGWTKNFASGAARSTAGLFIAVFFWVTALGGVPLKLLEAFAMQQTPAFLYYLALYILLFIHLVWAAHKVGNFRIIYLWFYPVLLGVFVGVFCLSAIKRLLHIPVQWKGRNIIVRD